MPDGYSILRAALLMFVLTAGVPAAADDPAAQVVKTFARFLDAACEDALAAAGSMQQAIEAFTARPSEESLDRARSAWTAARGPYLLTEIGRFFGGPADDDRNLENQINPWPVDSSFIESPPGGPSPGLIQNVGEFPRLSPEVLARLNARDGEQNISCGWHAIEFMLWGPDGHADGPGRRPVSDFIAAPHAARRIEFLRSATQLLVDDIEAVARGWRADPGTFRSGFESAPAHDSLTHICTAWYQLSGFEMASERLLVALETQAQEDEPDCFSDTTSGDFAWGVRALDSVWRGRWTRPGGEVLEGTGLRAFVGTRNPGMATLLDELLARAGKQAAGLPRPFDQVILQPDGAEPKEAVRTFATTLEELADLLAHFARKAGLDIDFEHHEEGVQPRGRNPVTNQ
jgi:putative iron-regulated protein